MFRKRDSRGRFAKEHVDETNVNQDTSIPDEKNDEVKISDTDSTNEVIKQEHDQETNVLSEKNIEAVTSVDEVQEDKSTEVKEVTPSSKEEKADEQDDDEATEHKPSKDELKAEKRAEKRRNKAEKKKNRANRHLFSWALFKENFKSHFKSLLIVSLGNATIMAIIIGILSGLHINATSNSLKDLFGSADTESEVKSGAISFYSAFNGGAESFDEFKNGTNTLEESLKKILSMPGDSQTTTKIDALKLVYNAKLLIVDGSDDAKHEAAKKAVIDEVEKTFTSETPDSQKIAVKTIINKFFDLYRANNKGNTADLLKSSIQQTLGTILSTTFNSSETESLEIEKIAKNIFDQYYAEGANKDQIINENVIKLMKYATPSDKREFAANLSAELDKAYQANPEEYVKDESIENGILKDAIIKETLKTVQSVAYLKYLPDFVVDCYTSNFGYPITYVPTGEYNDNGTEKVEMIEVKVYNPNVFIEREAKMGTTSNMVEKLHKEAITGEPYTEDQINEAKKEANDELSFLGGELNKFFADYIKNYDAYHINGLINEEKIISNAVSIVKSKAAETIINDYNDKHDVHITSIDEVTAKEYTMDGHELMQTVDSYAVSGIASYKTLYDTSISNGYSASDSQLIAVAKGSLGVIDQLPNSIQESLNEMGDMNTYGIIVGVIAFGIAVLLIPMVYTVLTANSLVSEKIESGSLAFTMSTPISRGSFIFTSGAYLVFTEIFMGLCLTVISVLAQCLGGWLGSGDLFTSLPIDNILAYAFGNFMVTLAISGICFMSSCFFNKTNTNIGVSGGISIFFFICAILGLFATKAIPGTIRIDSMEIFNYVTIFSLFDSLSVMSGDCALYWGKLVALLLIAAITYIIGSIKFTKKDLPL